MASIQPKIFYGLHMAEGVAEYHEENVNDGNPYRIFVGEKVAKQMNSTFPGKPVYVHHVDEVNLKDLHLEADGYVVESFYNPADGKNWAKFVIVSDKGHEAIRSGWKLSNAYVPKTWSSGGLWHGVEYAKEVMSGEYEHLAIVPNPRYEESVIKTPEEFKAYNLAKEQELLALKNSKDKGDSMKFNFFKKSKVENSTDLEGVSISLPKSKVEKTLEQVINGYDEHLMKEAAPQMANGDHKVKVGEEEMTVNELLAKHAATCNELAEIKKPKEENAGSDEAEGDMQMNEEDEAKEKDDKDGKKSNEADDAAKAAKAAADAAKAKENFDKVKNAEDKAKGKVGERVISTTQDQVARGQDRYGSKKK